MPRNVCTSFTREMGKEEEEEEEGAKSSPHHGSGGLTKQPRFELLPLPCTPSTIVAAWTTYAFVRTTRK